MTLKQFSLDGTLDVDATVANLGFDVAGPSTNQVNKAGGVIKFAERGVRFTSAAAGSYTIARTNALGSSTQAAFRGSFMIPALPTGDLPIAQIRGGVGDERVIAPIISATGAVTIYDRDSNAMVGSLGAIAIDTWYDISLVMTSGSTTAGAYSAQLFEDSSDTPFGTAGSSSTSNLTANAIDGFELGICTYDLTATNTVYWDNVQIDDGATAPLPIYAPPAATFDTYFGLDGTWVPGNLYVGDGTWRSLTDAGVGA